MPRLEEFDDVQLDVEFTQADSRSNLTTNENIAISFGKISKWYEALVPTGGSSGQFLGWNSSGTAKWVANPNTDTKVTSSANHYAPATASGEDKSASASGATAAWSIDVVKGVTLNTDGKGHVTGISVTSGKIPANPVPSNNVTGSGTSGYLTKWNGANTITNGPQLGSSTTTYLNNAGSWATPPDTKNTAGSTDTSSKIYLIGATSQATNPQTYSDNEVYTTSGVLTTKKVRVGGGSCTMEYNSTTETLDFVFA